MTNKVSPKYGKVLGLNAAWAMAVGGMIGGGIFSTLGVVIEVAGQWAWFSFLLGGIIAFCSGQSYVALTRSMDEGGGSYLFLRSIGMKRTAQWCVWILVIGYTLTVAVYGFTFGAYLSHALGTPSWSGSAAAIVAIATLAGINLIGAGQASTLEIVAVWGKLAILVGLAILGVMTWAPEKLARSGSEVPGFTGALVGVGTVFMAYEGFQLLSYDYDEMRDAARTIGLAMPLAIGVTILVYVLVALGAPMLAGAEAIVDRKEVALAEAGRDALGTSGFILVTIAAVFSTASAINATVFATARLARHAARDGEMPAIFAKENRNKVPWVGTVIISIAAAILAVFGGITQLVQWASLVFLLIFGMVNAIALKKDVGWRWLAWAGLAGALAAACVLLAHLAGLI